MKAKLDSRVADMRSQSMTFSNNGIDFSLSIPDSEDVKQTFKTFISTIMEQQNKIESLHHGIRSMAADHSKAQDSLVKWATGNLQSLKDQNSVLTKHINSLTATLKNFTYNMQGYVGNDDEFEGIQASSTDVIVMPTVPTFVLQSQPTSESNQTDGDFTVQFFPTEEGHAEPVQRPLATNHSKPAAPKVNRSKSRALDDAKSEAYEKAQPSTTGLPRHPKARWLWAFRQIKRNMALRRNMVSLSRARVAKGQSMMERLDRIDDELYNIPTELKHYVTNKLTIYGFQVKEMMEQLETKFDDKLQGLDKTLVQLSDDLQTVSGKAAEGSGALQSRIDELNTEIERIGTSRMTLLGLQAEEMIPRLERFIGEVNSAAASLTDLLGVAKDLTHKAMDDRKPSDLAVLLKVDTQIRLQRADMTTFSSSLKSLLEKVESLKTDALNLSPAVAGRDKVTDSLKIIETSLGTASTVISTITDCLAIHDGILSENWELLNKVAFAAAGSAEPNSPTPSSVKSFIDHTANIKKLFDGFKEISRRCSALEQQQGLEPAAEGGPDGGKSVLDSMEMDMEFGPNGNSVTQVDWTAQLKPLVKNIVAAYLRMEVGEDEYAEGGDEYGFDDDGSGEEGCDYDDGDIDLYDDNGDNDPTQIGGGRGYGAPTDGHKSQHRSNGTGGGGAEGIEEESELKVGVESGLHSSGGTQRAHSRPHRRERRPTSDGVEGNVDEDGAADETETEASAAAAADGQAGQPPRNPKRASKREQRATRATTGSFDDEVFDDDGVPAAVNESGEAGQARRRPKRLPAEGRGDGGEGDEAEYEGRPPRNGVSKASARPRGKPLRLRSPGAVASAVRNAADPGSPVQQSDRLYDRSRKTYSRKFQDESPINIAVKITNEMYVERDGSDLSGQASRRNSGRSDGGPVGKATVAGAAGAAATVGNALSLEITALSKKLDRMYREKLNEETGLALLASKANASDLHEKVDLDVFDTVRRSLTSLMQEMGDLKELQKEDVAKVQEKMESKLTAAIRKLMQEREQDNQHSVINTKAMCIGCGRTAVVKSIPSTRVSSPNFIPTLSSDPSAGPDIMRAGFKMPIRLQMSPPNSQYAYVNLDPLGTPDPLSALGMGEEGMNDTLSSSSDFRNFAPTMPMFEGNGSRQTVPYPGLAPLRLPSAMKAIRHAAPGNESVQLRSIHRKGFPGKKSMRAETTFAPERFVDNTRDSSLNGLSVMSRSMPRSLRSSDGTRGKPASSLD